VETIAYHYARTPAHAEAATWLERAGDRAAAAFASSRASTSATRAISLSVATAARAG
jgi:hypothetical protein